MTPNRFVCIVLVIALSLWAACEKSTDKPSGPNQSPGIVTDICDSTVSLGLNVEAASESYVLIDDSTLQLLGLPGAEALAQDLTSGAGFCELDVSPATQSIIDEADRLIATGKLAEARTLLATLLIGGGAGPSRPGAPIAANSAERQKVRDLLTAAARDQQAGGDGQAYMDQAGATYTTWAEGQLSTADTREALTIAAEAMLLGLDNLAQDAIQKVDNLTLDSYNTAIEGFDPCTATKDDARKLLESEAKALMMGVSSEESSSTVTSLVGQTLLHLGLNSDYVTGYFGDVAEPSCDRFMFEFTRTVSNGWTLTGQGATCDGILWQGTVNLGGIDGVGVTVSSSGTFEFTIPDGINTAQTTIPTAGMVSHEGEMVSFSDPLQMVFTFQADSSRADIAIFSTGAGLMQTPIGALPFASVFMTNPRFTVDLAQNPNCSGR